MDQERPLSRGSTATCEIFIGGETGARESLCCARQRAVLLVGPHSGTAVGGVSNCFLLPSWEGCGARGRACAGSCVGEFSPPCYIKINDGEAAASLLLRGAAWAVSQSGTLEALQRSAMEALEGGVGVHTSPENGVVGCLAGIAGPVLPRLTPRGAVSARGLWMWTSGGSPGEGRSRRCPLPDSTPKWNFGKNGILCHCDCSTEG